MAEMVTQGLQILLSFDWGYLLVYLRSPHSFMFPITGGTKRRSHEPGFSKFHLSSGLDEGVLSGKESTATDMV